MPVTQNAIATLVHVAKQALADGLNDAAKIVQAEARERVPKDEHKLDESLQVSPATPNDLTSSVYSNSPYAVPQHENLDWQHDEGEAKYLERATLESRQQIEAALAAGLREAFGG